MLSSAYSGTSYMLLAILYCMDIYLWWRMSLGNVRQQFIQTRAWTRRTDQAAAKLAVGIGEYENIKNTQISTSNRVR